MNNYNYVVLKGKSTYGETVEIMYRYKTDDYKAFISHIPCDRFENLETATEWFNDYATKCNN